MHLLTIADTLKEMNGAVSSFVATTMTIASMLESGNLNESQQQMLAKRLTDGIGELAAKLWGDSPDD